jgi:hypothetical protein
MTTLKVDTSEHNDKKKNKKSDSDEEDLPHIVWCNKDDEKEKKDDRYYYRENRRMEDEYCEYLKRSKNFRKQLKDMTSEIAIIKGEDEKIKKMKCMLDIYIENLDLLEDSEYAKLKTILHDRLLYFYHVDKWIECKEYFQKIFYNEEKDIENFKYLFD